MLYHNKEVVLNPTEDCVKLQLPVLVVTNIMLSENVS